MDTSAKLQKCKDFSAWLTKNRINHEIHNKGWHIQVQMQHHFYPSTSKYMNSESGEIKHYTEFKSIKGFNSFLAKHVCTK